MRKFGCLLRKLLGRRVHFQIEDQDSYSLGYQYLQSPSYLFGRLVWESIVAWECRHGKAMDRCSERIHHGHDQKDCLNSFYKAGLALVRTVLGIRCGPLFVVVLD